MALINIVLALLAATPAVLAAPYGPTVESAVAQKFLKEIENNFQVVSDNPPKYKSDEISEPTCFAYVGSCNPTYFHLQHSFINGTARASYITQVEHGIHNIGNTDVKLTVTQSTAVALGTTKGWNIGAKYTISGDIVGTKNGLEISGGYSESKSETVTTTRTIASEVVCRPGYACEIQTWTFHVQVEGYCKTRPIINCGGEYDACEKATNICSQYFDYFNKFCSKKKLAATTHCKSQTVINDASGKPLTKLVLVSNKIVMDGTPAKRSDADEIVEFIDFKLE